MSAHRLSPGSRAPILPHLLFGCPGSCPALHLRRPSSFHRLGPRTSGRYSQRRRSSSPNGGYLSVVYELSSSEWVDLPHRCFSSLISPSSPAHPLHLQNGPPPRLRGFSRRPCRRGEPLRSGSLQDRQPQGPLQLLQLLNDDLLSLGLRHHLLLFVRSHALTVSEQLPQHVSLELPSLRGC